MNGVNLTKELAFLMILSVISSFIFSTDNWFVLFDLDTCASLMTILLGGFAELSYFSLRYTFISPRLIFCQNIYFIYGSNNKFNDYSKKVKLYKVIILCIKLMEVLHTFKLNKNNMVDTNIFSIILR
jgi:hypothetical protein